MSNLQNILSRLRKPKTFPGAMPLIHVSKSGKPSFKQIVEELSLSPRHCDVFQKCLVYLSYGGAFYDPTSNKRANQIIAPICFLFNPKIMSTIDCYYPYDTGAAKYNKYGNKHSNHLKENFNTYKISANNNGSIHIPRQLVYYLYGKNRDYHIGKIKDKVQRRLYDSFPELFQFLKDQNIEGCDQRQHTIECQAEQQINLRDSLEWIAFPDRYNDLFIKLYNAMQPSPPEPCRYIYIPNRPTSQVIGEIQRKAQEYIQRRYGNPQ